MGSDRNGFVKDCAAWGLFPDETLSEKLERYYELLVTRNAQINLTAITEREAVMRLHFLDALAILQKDGRNWPENLRLIDVGSGAGFPGLVLKLFRPSWHVTLLDAQQKRVAFLNEAAGLLLPEAVKQKKIEVIHGRAETLAHDETYRAAFDLCTARAVSRLRVLGEYTLPFLRTGGMLAAYKSRDTDTEIAEAEGAFLALRAELTEVHDYMLPHSDVARRLVYVRKTGETDARYPRRAGIPEKRPL